MTRLGQSLLRGATQALKRASERTRKPLTMFEAKLIARVIIAKLILKRTKQCLKQYS